MIVRWGYKTLLRQKTTTISSILGVSFSFLLALFFSSVWQGETEQIVAYPKKLNPDLWVMQDGVSNMHMALSFVWDWKADIISKIPEVERVTGFLYLNTVIQVKDSKLFGFVVGLNSKNSKAGPWEIVRGRGLEAEDEIVIPEPMRTVYNIELGDNARVIDLDYRIVGFSKGTYSSANPVFFVMKPRLESSLSSEGTLSYFLVHAKPGVNINELKKTILSKIDKVNVITQEEFLANDYNMATQMGAETILIMTLICTMLSALIIGYTSFSMTIKKRREIAIIKAIGGKGYQLILVILMQSLIISTLAYLFAVMLLLLVDFAMPFLAPQITIGLSWQLLLQPFFFVILISILGSLYPAIKLIRLDPADAYRTG